MMMGCGSQIVSQLNILKKKPKTGIRDRIKKYQKAFKLIFRDGRNCDDCVHCSIYQELAGSDRSNTIYGWMFDDPYKIPNVLRPMVATVLMIPEGV